MKKILIVDDSKFMRTLIKDMLMIEMVSDTNNFEIYEADGKTTALKLIKEENPDIILLDIVMEESETEGVELLEAIKPFFDTKKVIVISSIGQTDIIEKCNTLGVSYYLQKPIEPEKVLEAVNRVKEG